MKTSLAAISDLDWNFDTVPDAELVACSYWEYARESAYIRETLQAYRQKPSCPGDEFSEEVRKLWNQVDKIQSIGRAAEVFVRGCCFEPGRTWQTDNPDKPNYRHPDAPPLTGSFPAPWQSLSEVERKYRANIRTHVEQFQIVPIKLSDWCWAKEIARECQCVSDQQHEQRKAWEKEYLCKDTHGSFATAPGAPPPPVFHSPRPRIRWGTYETLLVDIAWDSFTNDEIVNYFRRWLKVARPKEIPAPSDRGRKPKDWRAQLTRLAVLRLLSRFTALQLVADDLFPEIWKTKQFSGRKWADVTKWHDARREARNTFQRLFPFLPKSELSLSWQRTAPAK